MHLSLVGLGEGEREKGEGKEKGDIVISPSPSFQGPTRIMVSCCLIESMLLSGYNYIFIEQFCIYAA